MTGPDNNHNCIVIMRVQSTGMCSRAQHFTSHYVHLLLRGLSGVVVNLNFIHLCEIISDFELKLCSMIGDSAHDWSDDD